MTAQRVRPGPAPVVAIEPALLDEDLAAQYLSRSRAWLRAMRQEDHARARRGEPPAGPAWIVVRTSVMYRPADLRAWIDAQAVPRGVVGLDRRVRPAPACDSQRDSQRGRAGAQRARSTSADGDPDRGGAA